MQKGDSKFMIKLDLEIEKFVLINAPLVNVIKQKSEYVNYFT